MKTQKNTADSMSYMMRAIVSEACAGKHEAKRVHQLKERYFRAVGNQPYVPRIHGYCKI